MLCPPSSYCGLESCIVASGYGVWDINWSGVDEI